jgi:DUF4097 and DUF4098 domain-containing protein YvlB
MEHEVRNRMKKLTLVVIGCLLFSVANAKDVNESLDADAKGRVTIFNMAGSVNVEGWSRKVVEVTGSLGDDVEEFVFERDGDEIKIKVKVPGRRKSHIDITSKLTIHVPKGSSIEVATISADIEVEGVQGEQELQSVSGDIVTQSFAAEVVAESVSGDIDVQGDGKDTDAELASVSGDITAENLAGRVAAESVSGDVVVAGGSFDRAMIETVSGDIVYQSTLRKDGKLHVETVNGDVDINFVGDVSARFDIDTFNGDIENCFGPEARQTSRYAPGLELSFSEGAGEGRVVISTFNGDLTMCKK